MFKPRCTSRELDQSEAVGTQSGTLEKLALQVTLPTTPQCWPQKAFFQVYDSVISGAFPGSAIIAVNSERFHCSRTKPRPIRSLSHIAPPPWPLKFLLLNPQPPYVVCLRHLSWGVCTCWMLSFCHNALCFGLSALAWWSILCTHTRVRLCPC